MSIGDTQWTIDNQGTMTKRAANKKTPTELNLALLRSEFSVTSLAQKIGKSRQAVSGAINGGGRFPKVLSKIREVLINA